MHPSSKTSWRCDKCDHFYVDFDLQDTVERDDPANLRFCDCPWCKAHPDVAAEPEF